MSSKSWVIIDTSMILYQQKFALANLSVFNGKQEQPTGHIWGTLKGVSNLASHFDVVILAIDTKDTKRQAILSNYKSGRHELTGDPFTDWSVYRDLQPILKLATSFPNVFYIKESEAELENDDILASFMAESFTTFEHDDLTFVFRDDDILTTRCRSDCVWADHLDCKPIDRQSYIKDKYGFDKDFLPLLWPLIRGKSSNKLPPALPRFPTKTLVELCSTSDFFPDKFSTFESYIDLLASTTIPPKSWLEKLKEVKNPESEFHQALKRNYEICAPKLKLVSSMEFKKFTTTKEERENIISHYQMWSLSEAFI